MAIRNLTENDKYNLYFNKEYNSFKNAFYDKQYTFDKYNPKDTDKIYKWSTNRLPIENYNDEPKTEKENSKTMTAEKTSDTKTKEPIGMASDGQMVYSTTTGGLTWKPLDMTITPNYTWSPWTITKYPGSSSNSYAIYYMDILDPLQRKLTFKVEYACGDVANYNGYTIKEFIDDDEIFNMIVEDLYCMGSPSDGNSSFIIRVYDNKAKEGEELFILNLSELEGYKKIHEVQFRMMDLDCSLSDYSLSNEDALEFNILYERFTKMQSSVLVEQIKSRLKELAKQKFQTQSSSKS